MITCTTVSKCQCSWNTLLGVFASVEHLLKSLHPSVCLYFMHQTTQELTNQF
jgi:hypothetical protein